MPTGYTAGILKGITFEQFVWRCARSMGALIMMRDDSMDAPIPERFEPSDYHSKELAKHREELAKVAAMTLDECDAKAQADYDRQLAIADERRQEVVATRAAYKTMLSKVEDWIPPTPDHEGLGYFMQEQILESIRWDCDGIPLDEPPVKLSGVAWREAAMNRLLVSIRRHEKEFAEEVERTEARNVWLAELRASLQSMESAQ